MDLNRWVALAEIARPHGVKGEVRLKLFNTASDMLLEQDEVLVRTPDGEEHEVSVDHARRADDAILMKLYSVDDRDRADELRGSHICVRRKDFPPLEAGEHYTIDLVGASATLNGEVLGKVTDVTAYPTLDVLVVNDGKQLWEIPMSEDYVGKVDAENGRVEVLSLDELEPTPLRKPKPPPKASEEKAPEKKAPEKKAPEKKKDA
jgi:16S rRNA processing protein RimM